MFKQILKGIIFTGLFFVPFIPFLVSSEFFFPFITTKAFAWRIIIEIIFGAWILLALLDSAYKPKKSLIFYSIFGFLAIIGIADLFGLSPIKSFWSNYERMEGFISLIHLGMFFLVISSVFNELNWKRWWNTSLVASFLMVLYCIMQLVGLNAIHQGGVRVDGTLGNAIYLAVYMLIHIFIALLLMWREWKNVFLRWIYGILIVLQAAILYYTATRGAILGLIGGIFVMTVLNLWNKEDKIFRKTSIVLLTGLIILVSGFFAFKDSEFVTNSPVLSRFSSLNAAEIKTQGRYFVWPIGLKGFKDHPILGWGQENFNYVFQEYYVPEMYKLEPWFDRAHNIFLDWAVAGGILGLLSYLALYFALLWLIWKKESAFPYAEKTILTGLIAAYFFHNFFVFDHLISYVLFFSLLAYVHQRSEGEKYHMEDVPESDVKTVALPAVIIVLVLMMYFVNVKPFMANIFMINAMQAGQMGDVKSSSVLFERAYTASRLGRPEASEQMALNAPTILSGNMSMEEKNIFFHFVKDAVTRQTEEQKNDSRAEIIAGSFLYNTGQFDEARIHFEKARDITPGRQMIYVELAKIYLNQGEMEKAINALRYVGEISPDHKAQMDGFIKEIQSGQIK